MFESGNDKTIWQYSSLCCLLLLLWAPALFADNNSRLLATGGVSSVEGSAGGGILPWAWVAGYASDEQIQAVVNMQLLDLGEYQLNTYGLAIGLYDRLELSYQRQELKVSSAIMGQVFSALLPGQQLAPSTFIRQDIVGAKLRVMGSGIFDSSSWLPQVSLGVQYKHNGDFSQDLLLSSGDVPLPNQGIPHILGAKSAHGIDFYLAASKLWLGAVGGNNLLTNINLRMTKANSLGLLGFGTEGNDSYKLQPEVTVALLFQQNWALGAEWRSQSNRLTGLGTEQDIYDVFVAYFPTKSWSITAAYVNFGTLPFEQQADGFYLTATVNL